MPRKPTGWSSRSICWKRSRVDPELAGWNGIGFVVQAYQKRCPFVIDWMVDLARRSGRRIMVRLVKGAYWDAEIKRAQVDGLDGYPVYTRKVHTDVVVPRLRQQAAGARRTRSTRSSRRTTPRRWRRSTKWRGMHGSRRLRIPVPAWHGRDAVRRGRSARTNSTSRAASMRRSALTRRCLPTWCGACSKTAQTRRSSTAWSTRMSASTSWSADPVARVEHEGIRSASSHSPAARPVRRRTQEFIRHRFERRARACPAGVRIGCAAGTAVASGADARKQRLRRCQDSDREQLPVVNPADHGRPGRRGDRGEPGRGRGGAGGCARHLRRHGRAPAAGVARRCLSARPTCLRRIAPR